MVERKAARLYLSVGDQISVVRHRAFRHESEVTPSSEAALEGQNAGHRLLSIPTYIVGIDTEKLSDKGAGARNGRTGRRPEPTHRETWLAVIATPYRANNYCSPVYDNDIDMLRHPISLLFFDMTCRSTITTSTKMLPIRIP